MENSDDCNTVTGSDVVLAIRGHRKRPSTLQDPPFHSDIRPGMPTDQWPQRKTISTRVVIVSSITVWFYSTLVTLVLVILVSKCKSAIVFSELMWISGQVCTQWYWWLQGIATKSPLKWVPRKFLLVSGLGVLYTAPQAQMYLFCIYTSREDIHSSRWSEQPQQSYMTPQNVSKWWSAHSVSFTRTLNARGTCPNHVWVAVFLKYHWNSFGQKHSCAETHCKMTTDPNQIRLSCSDHGVLCCVSSFRLPHQGLTSLSICRYNAICFELPSIPWDLYQKGRIGSIKPLNRSTDDNWAWRDGGLQWYSPGTQNNIGRKHNQVWLNSWLNYMYSGRFWVDETSEEELTLQANWCVWWAESEILDSNFHQGFFSILFFFCHSCPVIKTDMWCRLRKSDCCAKLTNNYENLQLVYISVIIIPQSVYSLCHFFVKCDKAILVWKKNISGIESLDESPRSIWIYFLQLIPSNWEFFQLWRQTTFFAFLCTRYHTARGRYLVYPTNTSIITSSELQHNNEVWWEVIQNSIYDLCTRQLLYCNLMRW